jgi:hypothetical protein|tara:strand:- start:3073 stop:3201 length:129 start_codon:yes stop_codon:yes gene_type:complete
VKLAWVHRELKGLSGGSWPSQLITGVLLATSKANFFGDAFSV